MTVAARSTMVLRVTVSAVLVALGLAACGADEAPDEPTTTVDKCTNGKRNKGELGIDCGGTCKAACDGAACTTGADCKSTKCEANKCGASANKKCGVGTPAACADGETCQTDADCTSDYCDEAARCTAPAPDAHVDGRQNAGETDVDCGGASGKPCEAGQKCKTVDDCTSSCTNEVCDTPNDNDGKKNNDETDTDCGGPNAKKCGLGKACVANTDCSLLYCAADQKCGTPTATDGVKNGTETDTDCGGPALTADGVTVPKAPACALTKTCLVDVDCDSVVCADNKVCIESPSCRPVHGGSTCGTGETGEPGAVHESCCKTLSVGLTMTQNGVAKQVYLDKYEITAGRIRAWITAIKGQYAGVPNVQAWVKARIGNDPILAAMYTGNRADFLPAVSNGQLYTFPKLGGGTEVVDLGLEDQLGPSSYYRGVQVGGIHGCWVGTDGYGHRTYWYDAVQSAAYGEIFRGDPMKDILDEKSMNCMTPLMFAAFCAWDGGYMMSQPVLQAAYGTKAWPWGDLPAIEDNAAKISNYNVNTNFGTVVPRYLFPQVGFGTFSKDFSPIIAAPGRFPGDIASDARPNQESWMDLGGNMLEWSQAGGEYWGWTGASFEGHKYSRSWETLLYFLDKYGKGTSRCMRLK